MSESAKELIIFVCTSNTCRSPMAEAFGVDYLMRRGLINKYEVVSRSITEDYEPAGSPASSQGIQVLQDDFGLDITGHRSTLLTKGDVVRAKAIFGVTNGHVHAVSSMFPNEVRGKMYRLPKDISDPWHQPVDVYRRCANDMKPLVEAVLQQLE